MSEIIQKPSLTPEEKLAQLIQQVANIINEDRKENTEFIEQFSDLFEDRDNLFKTKEERIAIQDNLVKLLELKQKNTENLIKLLQAIKKENSNVILINSEKGVDTTKFIDEI